MIRKYGYPCSLVHMNITYIVFSIDLRIYIYIYYVKSVCVCIYKIAMIETSFNLLKIHRNRKFNHTDFYKTNT